MTNLCNVKHQLFLSDFKENLNFLDKFSQNTRKTNFENILPVKLSCSVHTYGRTDMTKLTVAFHSFAKAHRIHTDNKILAI